MGAARIVTRLFTLPKAGCTAEEYEDACAWDATRGAFAIADGASDSAFAGLWARLLAERFLAALPATPAATDWRSWLRPAQDEWLATIRRESLPWYIEARVRAGAFATFAGLLLRQEHGLPDHLWAALAVGDSCVFHITAKEAVRPSPAAAGFPVSRPHAFDQHPLALSSQAEHNEPIWPQVAHATGRWHPGDCFLLATDALAEWITREIVPEARWPTFLQFLETQDDATFARFATDQRRCGNLRNDDLTLLVIQTVPW
jgi:hypothetical protein